MAEQKYDLPDATVIWRYMHIGQLLEICLLKRLRLTQLHRFHGDDGYEGGPTSINLIPIDPKVLADPEMKHHSVYCKDILEKVTKSIAVTCWRQDEGESLMMWKLYGGDTKHQVAVKSTVGRLKESVGSDEFHVGKVDYYDMNHTHKNGETLDDIVFHKQIYFEYEKEVRGWVGGDPSKMHAEQWNLLEVQPETLIESIVMSRRCESNYVDVIRCIAPYASVRRSSISMDRFHYLSPLEMKKLRWI